MIKTLSLVLRPFGIIKVSHAKVSLVDVLNVHGIDAHGLKIQGRGYLMFFAKIFRGGQGFQEKLPGGVHLFCILLHFY